MEEEIKIEKKKGTRYSIIILIEIVIIVVPILIFAIQMYNDSNNTCMENSSIISAQEVQSYNEQFERYEGEAVKGTTVKAMINTVRNRNNATRTDPSKMVQLIPDSDIAVDISASIFSADPNEGDYAIIAGNIKAGKQYLVQCGYDPETGFVTSIAFKSIENNIVEQNRELNDGILSNPDI